MEPATGNEVPTPRRDFWRDPRPSNQNPNFVRDYFASSRLHFIGSFRARYESMMVAVGQKLAVNPARLLESSALRGQQSLKRKPAERVIVHIDMDCFFASIAIKKDPSLAGKCIAVAHGGGEISSCSYEARKFGVRAGMFCKDAKKFCPDLLSVPYDFPMYEETSIQIYALFYDYPGVCVEAVSVDEAYLDITLAVGEDREGSQSGAEALVEMLRSRILAKTGCTASAGIGPSKLIARLATKAAKPNGQLRIRQEGVVEYLDTLRVKDLPGIGWRTNKRFKQLSVETCPQLRSLPLKFLQSEFGDRQGQVFYDLARALDARPVEPLKPRKSIGAEASWGVRFNENEGEKVQKFLSDIADEVASRVNAAGASGTKVIFKVYKRKPNADMTGYKHLGHGPCTIFTRSAKLHRGPSDSLQDALRATCLRLHADLGVLNEDLRGVGLQMTDLRFADLSFDYTAGPTSGVTRRIDSYFAAKPAPSKLSAPSPATKTAPAVPFEEAVEKPTQRELCAPGPSFLDGSPVFEQTKALRTDSTLSAPIVDIPVSEATSLKPEYSELENAKDISHTRGKAIFWTQREESNNENDDGKSHAEELEIEEDRIEPGPLPTTQPPPNKVTSHVEELEIEEDRIEPGPLPTTKRPSTPPTPPSPPSPLESQQVESSIPRGWDKQVFLALPKDLQRELLSETHSTHQNPLAGSGEDSRTGSEVRRGASRKRRRDRARNHVAAQIMLEKRAKRRQTAQVTMTQFADISELKDKGNDMLNAEEFRDRGLRDCVELLEDLRGRPLGGLQSGQGGINEGGHARMRNGGPGEMLERGVSEAEGSEDGGSGFDIPSPPSLSSDSTGSYGFTGIVERCRATAEDPVYGDDALSDYAIKLYDWMQMQRAEVKSGHVELLRGRIVELVRRKRLERAVAEVRVVRLFAKGMGEWDDAVGRIVEEVQEECRRIHGFGLVIEGGM